MWKKILGTFTAVVSALAVVGVAWAGTDEATSTSLVADGSTAATIESSTSATTEDTTGGSTNVTVESSSSTDATVGSSTPTTIDDDSTSTSADDSSTTSTSVASSTSTSVDSTTSTSLDDDRASTIPDGVSTHRIPGVGSVTIAVAAGRLALVDTALSWSIVERRVEADRIELSLESGDAEARFEARLHDGRVEVEVRVDAD